MTTELTTYTPQLPVIPDVKPAQIEWIMEMRQNPARAMMEQELNAQMAIAFAKSAAYFNPPEPYEQTEFAAVFQLAYPNMNPLEIQAALRMNATGQFGDDDTKQRIFYANKFNVSTMCAILNVYQDWRQKVVAGIVNAEAELKRENERQAADQTWIAALEVSKERFLAGDYTLQILMYAKPNKQEPYIVEREIEHWEDIPPYWLKWANEKGLLVWIEGEAAALRDEAEQMAKAEIESENGRLKESGRIGEVLNGDRFSEKVEARARVIRCKLAVWRKLVKPAK